MTTAIIVQARMGSKRLPGKVMAKIGDRTAIAHVLDRCLSVPGIDHVGAAIPNTLENEPLADEIRRFGIEPFLGDETDVLGRYVRAVLFYEQMLSTTLDRIIRITADCPLIDPHVVGQLASNFSSCDYASNCWPRTYPHGLDCEIFSRDLLFLAHRKADSEEEREHVTPWMVNHAKKRGNLENISDMSMLRLTLDYPKDLEFFRALHSVGWPAFDFFSVIRALERRPAIATINQAGAAL